MVKPRRPFRPTTLQLPPGNPAPRSSREAYAEALREAELEYRNAQAALELDDFDTARARYAAALAHYDTLQGMFPLVAAGVADVQA